LSVNLVGVVVRVGVNFQAGFQASASLSGGVLTRASPSIEWGGFGADSPSMSGGVLDKAHWKSKRPHSLRGRGLCVVGVSPQCVACQTL
jgi:hypothetical protein